MKDKTPKKSKIPVGSDFHRKCHMAYTPRVVKPSRLAAKHNVIYDQYIVMSDDSEQETSNPEKYYSQNETYHKKHCQQDEISDHKKCYPKSESSNHKKSYQNEVVIDMKHSYIMEHESFIRDRQKEDPEELVKCYIDRNYYNNPIVMDSEAKKSALPIKKISFDLPPSKSEELDVEQMDWHDYHKLSVIYKFMDDLEADFPSLCTTGTIGTSVEGRNLKILKVSNSHASNACVWVDAGIHAREWIAPAVNTYIANYITKNFETLPDSVKNKDWYFLPVVNPDGYEYTHTTDRMWRKNRAWHGNKCVGVDLNRNFSLGWGGKGSSDVPTNVFYRGPEPFSEPESSAIRDIFLKSGIKFKVYITLHSYGQIIIFPYACSSDLAPDYVRLLEGATAMSKAIFDTNGNTYKVGISRDVMYGAAGTSNDFAHGAAGIPYCYLIELRSKKHKFRLPKEEIEETGNEILNCLKALMEFVDTYTYTKRTDDPDLAESEIEKTDSIINYNTIIPSSVSYINRGDSNIRKRDSYDKQTYSYIKKSDSYMKEDTSYVRWSHLPQKKTDDSENTGDTWNTNPNDFVETGTSPGNLSKNSFMKYHRLKDGSDSFLDKNDSFLKRTERFNDASDSFINRSESYNDTSDSFIKRSEYFNDTSDAFLKENELLLKKINSYKKKYNTSEKTDNTFVETDTKQR